MSISRSVIPVIQLSDPTFEADHLSSSSFGADVACVEGGFEEIIFSTFVSAPWFSTFTCVVVGRRETDRSVSRLIELMVSDGRVGAIEVQIISQPTEDSSVGYSSLTREDLLSKRDDIASLSRITSLTVNTFRKTLNLVVGSFVSPSSIALLRSSSLRMVVVQISRDEAGVAPDPLDALAVVADVRALCDDSTASAADATSKSILLGDEDPFVLLRQFCSASSTSTSSRAEILTLLDRIQEQKPELPALGGVAESSDVPTPSLCDGRQLTINRPQPSPSDAGFTAPVIIQRNESFEIQSPVVRISSYIPPTPLRTEVVLASTGW